MKSVVDNEIQKLLDQKLNELEDDFKADVLTYFGLFIVGMESSFLKIIEDIANVENPKNKKIYIILTTEGGNAIVVERFVNILRHWYKEVNFIVPDYAYSAGTIFCMSGDSILMDYSSVLGPIDPQIQNKEGKWVAALGYLDKINELLDKAQKSSLTQAEFIILKNFDLAELREYEQAKNLTIDLLKKWLVKYKFKNWKIHRTNKEKQNNPVTEKEKIDRAKGIANHLSDNNEWKSHRRPINIAALKKLGLKIEDYSDDKKKRSLIKSYYNLVESYISDRKIANFVHTRKTF